jgi:cobalt/nickel transport system permease protein
MHMADALISPAVGGAMYLASAAAVAYSTVKMKKDELGEKKLPVMAIAGAFVFAGQMINFTIPATGSSGHIGGGILLAALLGGYPALLAIAAVLIIQCLFFADGGLLALGCNIFNMGVIPCLLVYPLIYRPIVKKGFGYGRIVLASVLSVVAGLQLGAFGVGLQTLASGVTALPFSSFVVLMQPIHLAIGVVEGLATAAILSFVYRMRPEILESAATRVLCKKAYPSRASSPC